MKPKCPTCENVVGKASGEQAEHLAFFPFCSERCKLVDLGAWLDGQYRMAAEPDASDAEQV